MLEYKGYVGVMEIDEDSGVIGGRVIGTRATIHFEGDSVAEARQAFKDSIDDYLDWCAERGKPPEKAYSGEFRVRMTPELHRALAAAAAEQRTSLNSLVESTLAERYLAHAK